MSKEPLYGNITAVKQPTEYEWFITRLKSMNESQLIELFHDMDDIDAVERISQCAEEYVQCGLDQESIGSNDEHKRADDAQRYRDIQSEKRGYE